MALPIANLGYMPNMNTPHSPGIQVIGPNAWEKLAMQVAGSLATNGINNGMSKDYTTQAQNEGLAVDPQAQQASFIQKLLQGPTTDSKQLDQLRQQKSAAGLENTREAGATERTNLTQAGENARNDKTVKSNSDQAEQDRIAREFITKFTQQSEGQRANNQNAAHLTGVQYAEQQANARAAGNNATSTRDAEIMAGSPMNQARILQAAQAIMQQGKTSMILDPTNSNAATGGLDPQVMQAVQEMLRLHPELRQQPAPAAQPAP